MVRHCDRMFLLLLLHPGLPGPVPKYLCRSYLDGPSKPHCESAVWWPNRSISSSYYFRLDADCRICWLAAHSAVVCTMGTRPLKCRIILTTSRHAIANTLIGVVVFFVVGSSVLHFGGAWYGEYLPMSDSGTYDNTGARYNTTRILTKDFTLNEEEYKNYSPLFIRYDKHSVYCPPELTSQVRLSQFLTACPLLLYLRSSCTRIFITENRSGNNGGTARMRSLMYT